MFSRLLREPLLHFLLLGAVLFAVDRFLPSGLIAPDERTIVVDRDALAAFIRGRTQPLDVAAPTAILDSLSAEERAALMRDFVRTEALHREALALGLDRGDDSIRQRLVQQMEHLLRALSEEPTAVEPNALGEYYAAHRARYREPARVTFAHVFVAPRRSEAEDEALERALRLRDELRAQRVTFSAATAFGDRFAYGVNYVGRTAEDVAADFGTEAQLQLFSLEPSRQTWQGPLRSVHGWHIVMIAERQSESDPPIERIRARLERDMRRDRHELRVSQAIDGLVARYRLRIDPTLRSGS